MLDAIEDSTIDVGYQLVGNPGYARTMVAMSTYRGDKKSKVAIFCTFEIRRDLATKKRWRRREEDDWR
jgi:hypothetical protein